MFEFFQWTEGWLWYSKIFEQAGCLYHMPCRKFVNTRDIPKYARKFQNRLFLRSLSQTVFLNLMISTKKAEYTEDPAGCYLNKLSGSILFCHIERDVVVLTKAVA